MSLKSVYNLIAYEATTAAEIADHVFASNELVTALDTGVSKKGDGVTAFSELPEFGGGGSGDAVTWATLTGKPAVIASGADVAAARVSIGAGTSSLVVATTVPAALAAASAVGVGTTAARADHVHALPTAAQVGAAATSHTQAFTTISGTATIAQVNTALTGLAAGTNVAVAATDTLLVAIAKLQAQITALAAG